MYTQHTPKKACDLCCVRVCGGAGSRLQRANPSRQSGVAVFSLRLAPRSPGVRGVSPRVSLAQQGHSSQCVRYNSLAKIYDGYDSISPRRHTSLSSRMHTILNAPPRHCTAPADDTAASTSATRRVQRNTQWREGAHSSVSRSTRGTSSAAHRRPPPPASPGSVASPPAAAASSAINRSTSSARVGMGASGSALSSESSPPRALFRYVSRICSLSWSGPSSCASSW